MADRFTYLPIIGLFVMIAWGVNASGRSRTTRSPILPLSHSPILSGIAIIVIALLAASARHQLNYWKDSITLFEHTLAVTKQNYTGHLNLALAYADADRSDDAVEQYRYAVRILPTAIEAHVNLAVLLYNKGDYAGAWEEVHACRDLGFEPNADFVASLAWQMPDPASRRLPAQR